MLFLFPVSAQSAVTFTRVDSLLGIRESTYSYGLNWGDFNSDGFDDVFVTNHYAPPNLFQNVSGGTSFVERIWASGISTVQDQHGAAWGDFDNDGRRDMYTVVGAPGQNGNAKNQLGWNLDGLHFQEIAVEAGVADSTGRGRFCHWVDADRDGWLDLFVTNYAGPNRLFLNRGDGTFESVPGAGGLGTDRQYIGAFTELNGDGYLDALLVDHDMGEMGLYRNSGGGSFQDITGGSGFPTPLKWIWGLCWLDYDNDGDQDVFLSRGYWVCQRDAYLVDETTFRFQSALLQSPAYESGSDGYDISADCSGLEFTIRVDNLYNQTQHIYLGQYGLHPPSGEFTMLDGQYQGEPDFEAGESLGCFIWQDAAGGPWHVRTATDRVDYHRFWLQADVLDGSISQIDTTLLETEFIEPDLSDRLYENVGNSTFVDVSLSAGISDELSGKNCVAVDVDNDGWLDIYVVNDRVVSTPFAHNAPNFLYMNNGDGTFTERAAEAGVECVVTGSGAAVGWSDYDGNGFPDLYVVNGWAHWPFADGPHVLYRNDGNDHHWLKVRLVGISSNRDAIGARVRIVAGGQTQYRVQNGSVNDMGQSSMDIHFGLAEATAVDSLTVWWPNGSTETFTDLLADQTLLIVEEPTTSVAGDLDITPAALRVFCPNPFRAPATVRFDVPSAADVKLEIFDVGGRLMQRLVEGRQAPGRYTVVWDGRDAGGRPAAGGVYFIRLTSDDMRARHRIVLAR